jgi:hypothetical protein
MFCPKCGIENPDHGKFCRSCGSDLGVVSAALMGKSATIVPYTVDPRKRGVSWEAATTKIFTGAAFLLVSLILGITGKIGAENWWFWLLIPGFALLSSGIAQVIQLKKLERLEAGFPTPNSPGKLSAPENNPALPPSQNDYIKPQSSIYETEDLVETPVSVTENTTRHLEMNKENETKNWL